ncbi:hypothetical protein [Chromobacterium violaceum]|uniref:hypothetical protein n=1 Tax=Chromobacterium violaceum TaxID=536 RepID=UPI00111C8E07|nr:hypothetical protein [Chromobacterium violaceum]
MSKLQAGQHIENMAKQPIVKIRKQSWHKSPGYRSQLDRLERWYARAQLAKDLLDIEDYLYAFFQNCYYLREWLPEEAFSTEQVNQFFKANIEMKVCRDLANLTKHRELHNPPATNAEPSIARIYVPNGRGWFGSDAALVVLTDVSDHPFDLLELAGRCLILWREFMDTPNTAS